MKGKLFLLILVFVFQNSFSQTKKLTDYVDPFIGTGGHGHTYPGATLPFGMMQLSPDTGIEGWDWCSGYHYSDNSIMGFSHTHLSGTGATDYADILFMPTVGPLKFTPGSKDKPDEGYRSRFRHENEKATPGYYAVYLDDYKVIAEMTVSMRSGIHKYTFPRSSASNIIIDLNHGLDSESEAMLKITGPNKIEGFRKSRGWAREHTVYFAAEFSAPFMSYGTVLNEIMNDGNSEASGKNVKGYVRFFTYNGEEILMRIGISAVSIEGARKNLKKEIPRFEFEKTKLLAQSIWEKELNRIQVESENEDQKKIFYTALYHTMITPNIFTDVDGKYSGMDKKVHTAKGFNYYTVFSLWDTFRAQHPLFTIIDQKRAGDFIKTLLAKYDEAGLLPVWELASNETWTMIGYHSIPVIFDAYMKGIRGYDLKKTLEAMKASAERDQHGQKLYRERGYLPADKENESVSKTLEYSYDDWCIAQFAKKIGAEDDYRKYNQRSLFYKNLYDKSTGFMRGKMSDGSWITPFEPKAVTQQYTEANAYQYNFFVPQDVKGLIDLHGGNENFIRKLDGLFEESDKLEGRFQPDISGLIGQYAHGNEPSHNFAYLYNHAGAAWKSQERIRDIMNKLYTSKEDGLCGNDDCGQLSAWYVFSAMGFYPVTPGQNTYAIGSPIFNKVTINLENGKKFIITAINNSEENKYIQTASFNGTVFEKSFITHEQIMGGGSLTFVMNDKPNKIWGADYSGLLSMRPVDDGVLMPYITSSGETFYDSLYVSLKCETEGTKIRYTIDGSEPTFSSPLYEKPILLYKAATIKAFSYLDRSRFSFTMSSSFIKSKFPAASYAVKYHERYNGGGAMALTDGRFGTENFQNGEWQGFEGDNLDVVIDLTKPTHIRKLSIGFLNDPNVWIFLPSEVIFYTSDDGVNFRRAADIINDFPATNTKNMIKRFSAEVDIPPARYIKVFAHNIGTCPPWHKGAGEKSWIFADEVVVE
ncbi:MAG: sugar hydrolase [Ignavibacteriae bacterium HGW-Ignavibacteriae-3]|nr:MAG: sugar hydrolase [Ignavibacteriae bacterium HGW-Ignavibacteriae-3]